jgi:hypothetical protein
MVPDIALSDMGSNTIDFFLNVSLSCRGNHTHTEFNAYEICGFVRFVLWLKLSVLSPGLPVLACTHGFGFPLDNWVGVVD